MLSALFIVDFRINDTLHIGRGDLAPTLGSHRKG